MYFLSLLLICLMGLILHPTVGSCKEYSSNTTRSSSSNQNLSSLKDSVQDLQGKNERLIRENESLTAKIRVVKKALRDFQGKREKASGRFVKKKMDDHRRAKEIFFAEKELARLNDDLSKTNEELNNLQQKFHMKSDDLDSLENGLFGSRRNVLTTAEKSSFDKNKQKRIELLEDHYRKLSKEYAKPKALLEKLTARNNVIRKEKDQNQNDYAQALKEEEKIRNYSGEGDAQEGQLDGSINELKSHIGELEQLLDKARKKEGQSDSEPERQVEAQKRQLEQNIEVFKRENVDLQKRLMTLERNSSDSNKP